MKPRLVRVDRFDADARRRCGPHDQPDVMGYHDRARDPELLGVRGAVRPAGPHVRAGRLVDAARPSVPRLGVVARCCRPDRSDELPVGHRPDEPGQQHRHGDAPDLRVDRHHVPAAQRRRELGVLRRRGHAASTPPCPAPEWRRTATPSGRNPLPGFTTVHEDDQLGNIQTHADFVRAAAGRHAAGGLVAHARQPRQRASAHGTPDHATGRPTSRRMINAVMRGPDWDSTAIFLTWDDWGGFYDHVRAAARRPERLRPAGAGHRDQPVGRGRASTTRSSRSTPT